MPVERLSPELRGGFGLSFEDAVVAVYLAALLSETAAPGMADRRLTRVALQQAAFGEPLDDVIVDGCSSNGDALRLALQVKTQITISAAPSNTDCREAVVSAALTVQSTRFREGVDRVGLVTGQVAATSQRSLLSVCALAREAGSFGQFRSALLTPGFAGETRRNAYQTFVTILSDAGHASPEETAFNLLRHFVLIEMDLLHPGATGDASAVAALAQTLKPEASSTAHELWVHLSRVAREGATAAAVYDRPTLVARLRGAFSLIGAPSLRSSLRLIEEEARRALAEIPDEICGRNYTREEAIKKATASAAIVTHLTGLPGAGKSAVLRNLAEKALEQGPALFLKSGRLSGSNWRSYATSMGLGDASLEDILIELSATGAGIVFVDGVDRVEVEHRGVVRDVLTTVFEVNARSRLRVILTVRGSEREPLQNWLPEHLLGGNGTEIIAVDVFNDDECRAIVADFPALRPLLFGGERVSEVARRPFFTSLLAKSTRSGASNDVTSVSEVDLAMSWWDGGGLISEGSLRTRRQRTLVALASAGATRLGRRIAIADLDVEAVHLLCVDGVIREVRGGHEVSFAHDIFFEWAFLQMLMGQGGNWPAQVQRAGEPPALGRTVELLSQWAFERNEAWTENFRTLERLEMRSQWKRAWLTGPFDSPRFQDGERQMEHLLFADDAALFGRLTLWFQAERTRPNPMVLAGAGNSSLEPRVRLRVADAVAWPSDYAAWARFLAFLLRTVPLQPVESRPAVTEAFAVWQNLFRSPGLDHPISRQICGLVDEWLTGIEAWRYAEACSPVPKPWDRLPRGSSEALETRLRSILLTAGPREVKRIAAYLGRFKANRKLVHQNFEEVSTLTPLLVQQGLASLLREITLSACLQPLPEQVEADARQRRDLFGRSFSYHDWQHLAADGVHCFHPPSPLREPFKGMFEGAADEARRLVRQLANHAVTAWRQLHRLDYERRGTPIPAVVRWPWGDQYFWGDDRTFCWPRGVWAPPTVGNGLMALEAWALKELENGRQADEVIQDVVEGHESNAVLSTAVLLSLVDARGTSSAAAVAACQRVWRWEERRFRDDLSQSANLIGFTRPSDRELAEAVRSLNQLPARRLTMPSLAMTLVLRQGEIGDATREAISRFAENLPFDLEEEKAVPEAVEALGKGAAERLPLAVAENYKIERAPEPNLIQVTFDDPSAQDPQRQSRAKEARDWLELSDIAMWASKAFESGQPIARDDYVDRLNKARAVDRPHIFEAPPPDEAHSPTRSAVASAAAACLALGLDLSDEETSWCRDVVLRAATEPASPRDWDVPQMIPVFNVVALSARGVAALARKGLATPEDLDMLLKACAHPLEAVAIDAAAAAATLHEGHPRVALAAILMCLQRAVVPVRPFDPSDATRGVRVEQARLVSILANTRRWLRDGSAAFRLCPLPAPLSPPVDDRRQAQGSRRSVKDGTYLHYQFLGKLLAALPIEALVTATQTRGPLLMLLESLAAWTVASLRPSEAGLRRRWRDDDRDSELMGWATPLYGCLARAALILPTEYSRRIFIDPICSLPDEAVEMLLSRFVIGLSARGVMDPSVPSATALELLQRCSERVARIEQLKEASYEGNGLSGYYLSDLLRDLLFVNIEGASGATRFANGDYSSLLIILPIVDTLVSSAARSRAGLDAYLSLCERSTEYFPSASFVEIIISLLHSGAVAPIGWLGTSFPTRIATLVNDFAVRERPLSPSLGRGMLIILDALIDIGDRKSAALQSSQIFREITLIEGNGEYIR